MIIFLVVLMLVGCAKTSTVETTEVIETTIFEETEPYTTEVEETYTEPTEPEPTETEPTEAPYVFNYETVPAYYQTDYPHVWYGTHGTVKTHGCGIVSLAMVLTYLTDTEHLPDELAKRFGMYNTPGGSSWTLFYDTAPLFGLEVPEVTYEWDKVVAALENGQVVIAQANKESLFTNNGHFIVLTGITEDGKILVNDPYYFTT